MPTAGWVLGDSMTWQLWGGQGLALVHGAGSVLKGVDFEGVPIRVWQTAANTEFQQWGG